MQESSNINPKQKTLFALMRDALNLAKQMKKENIILLGQSRSGKSTTFNWISDHRLLIGGGQSIDPVYQINSLYVKEHNAAQVKKGYKSVTLIPNFYPLSKDLGLIDMPGTRDQRTQIHVMMVNFIYNVFLKFSKKAKFILVITNQGFKAPDSAKMVNLVSMFIKLFKCAQMPDEQLQNLFRSVSILVTSVPIENGKEQLMKTYYCKLLTEKLRFLKQLQEYEKIGEIYTYIQLMLLNIIQNKRIELFPKARFHLSPQPCKLLQRLKERKWGTCQLHSLSQFLKFPYTEQFMQLSNDQQQNLKRILQQKIQDYKVIRRIFAKFIENYLNSPINNTYQYDQYEQIYQNLEQFYLQRLLETEEQKQKQKVFLQELEEEDIETDHSPVLVLQNILKMHKITFQIAFQDERKQNQRNLNEFEYFKGFYSRQLNYIIQAFALTTKAKVLLTRINNILLDRIDYFMYISQMQASAEGSLRFELKEAIQIMNQFGYREFQIIDKFCASAYNQRIGQDLLNIPQIVQIIKFLNSLNFQQQESASYFEILLKFYRLAAQRCKQEKREDLSTEFYLQILINLVKLKIVFQLQVSYSIRKQEEIIENINKIDDQLQLTLYQLSLQIIQVNENIYGKLQQIYRQSNLQCHLQKIYAKIYQKLSQNTVFLKAYLSYNERNSNYPKSLQILKTLIKKIQKSEKQYYKQKKNQFESKSNIIPVQREHLKTDLSAYLQWAHLVFIKILDKQRARTNLKLFQSQISQKYRNRLKENENKSQFTIQLPQKLSNYDIIVYSRYLISKIKNRNTIVILGGKAGKSTMSYWLRGKELIKQNDRIDLKDRASLNKSTINHVFSSHTEVPNIYSLNDDELLIDAPHIYQKNAEKILIIGYFLTQILMHSRQSKFILVVKEEDIIKKQCIPLIQMLQFYIKIFKDFQKNIELSGGLSLLINFSEGSQVQIRKHLKQQIGLFASQQKADIVEQKYRLSRASNPCSRAEIYSVFYYIFQKGLLSYFDINRKVQMIEDLMDNRNWIFVQTKSKIHQQYSTFKPTLHFKEETQQSLILTIHQKIKKVQEIIRSLTSALQTIVKIHRDKRQLERFQIFFGNMLTQKLGKQFVQAQYNLRQSNPNMRNFKYADLQIPRNNFHPQVSLLRLFLTYKITDVYNQDHQFSSICDLKKATKKVCHIFMSGVGAYFSNPEIVQVAWIKIWQILTELEILEIQTKFPKEGLSQIQAYKQYEFGLTFSTKEEIRQQLFMTKGFYQFQWLQMFVDQFNLEQFKNEIEAQQLKAGFDLLYQVLRSIKSIITTDNRVIQFTRKKWQAATGEAMRKLKSIQKFFIEKCTNDQQVAIVLLEQSEIQIAANNYNFISNNDQFQEKKMILILQNNIEKLCQKIAIFNSQLALSICDKMRKNALKQRIFQILEKKEVLKMAQFRQFLYLLLENGSESKAFALLQSYKLKVNLQDKEYEEMKYKILQTKPKDKQKQKPINFTLKQLEQIIIACKAKLLK